MVRFNLLFNPHLNLSFFGQLTPQPPLSSSKAILTFLTLCTDRFAYAGIIYTSPLWMPPFLLPLMLVKPKSDLSSSLFSLPGWSSNPAVSTMSFFQVQGILNRPLSDRALYPTVYWPTLLKVNLSRTKVLIWSPSLSFSWRLEAPSSCQARTWHFLILQIHLLEILPSNSAPPLPSSWLLLSWGPSPFTWTIVIAPSRSHPFLSPSPLIWIPYCCQSRACFIAPDFYIFLLIPTK